MPEIRVCTYDGPGTAPVIRTVPWPKIPAHAALIKVGACGVCGTDLHILKGHWPKPLPWPFTLGHEIGGVLVEVGSNFTSDFMDKPLRLGSKVMIPPLMPCGRCYYCVHYPDHANKCLTPVYYGRYLGDQWWNRRFNIDRRQCSSRERHGSDSGHQSRTRWKFCR